jgi:hypothetical protein
MIVLSGGSFGPSITTTQRERQNQNSKVEGLGSIDLCKWDAHCHLELANVTYRRSVARQAVRMWKFSTTRRHIEKDAEGMAVRIDRRKFLVMSFATWKNRKEF